MSEGRDREDDSFIDRLSYRWLVPLALLTLLAPWPFGPEPHVVEKMRWLSEGRLTRLIDVFDLLFHAAASALFVTKLLVGRWRRSRDGGTGCK